MSMEEFGIPQNRLFRDLYFLSKYLFQTIPTVMTMKASVPNPAKTKSKVFEKLTETFRSVGSFEARSCSISTQNAFFFQL